MKEILKELLSQFIALAAFFAFPAIQYALLKWINKPEGTAELWYLPKWLSCSHQEYSAEAYSHRYKIYGSRAASCPRVRWNFGRNIRG